MAEGLQGMLGCSLETATRYLAASSGDTEQALMRWLGHGEVMTSIVASWASLGDLPASDPFASSSSATSSAGATAPDDSGGGGGGGDSDGGAGGGDAGSGDGVAGKVGGGGGEEA
uniref:Uncharacterized protein n=1 Tax=Bicosoecida sp. CB-2014 TaxID=1486930 RepID=A0A7S1CAP6_9STRA|mmetsp:Transcript_1980/g.6321  ORF Transcript_1980/g.6321 Transcript_1980/m.6321 type:complete len:115 (+) Transcript_1980:40-384(+)